MKISLHVSFIYEYDDQMTYIMYHSMYMGFFMKMPHHVGFITNMIMFHSMYMSFFMKMSLHYEYDNVPQ